MLQNTYYHLLYPDSPYYSALWHIASPSSKFVATYHSLKEKKMKIYNHGITSATLLLLLSCVPSAYSSGLQITQQSGPALLRSMGGAGLSGDDLGDLFYNPASLWLYEDAAIQVGVTTISTDIDVVNTGSLQSIQGRMLPVQGANGRLDDSNVVPRGYAVLKNKDNNNYQYAVHVTPTFGQETHYADNWFGRYHAVDSTLKVLDYGLIVGRKTSGNSYISVSPIIQQLDTRLTRALQFSPSLPDGSVILDGDSTELGYALGWSTSRQLDGETGNAARFGISFRSKTSHKINGTTTINTPLGPDVRNATADLILPETVYLNYWTPVGSSRKSSIGLTARWTNWSRNQAIIINSENLPPDVTPHNWKDSWMLGIGGTVNLSNNWNLLLGTGLDKTPVQDSTGRTARNPGADTTWFSIGAQYLHNHVHRWSFGIVYWDFDDGDIQTTAGLGFPPFGADVLNGTAKYGATTGVVLEDQRTFK